MEIVLLEELPGYGHIGDVVRVRDGYFRNFLEPRGKALRANPSNMRVMEDRKRGLLRRAARELNDAQALAAELEKATLTFALKAGENDRLFGSVTNADIADKLSAQGFTIDRRKIVLDEPLKSLGAYTVHVHLAPGVEAKVRVLIEKQVA